MSFEFFLFFISFFVINYLSTLKLANTIATMGGPFDMFQKFRQWLYVEDGTELQYTIYDLFNCPKCLSVYISTISWILWVAFPWLTVIILLPFAVSACTELHEKPHE